jgi:RNA-directed DNA polymerase
METSMGNTPVQRDGFDVSTKQARIAELARMHAGKGLDNLHPVMDVPWLRAAYERTRKDGAPGIDGATWEEYGQNLSSNLTSLLQRVKSGTYRAPPVRRAYIPKGNGEHRPIGIPTLEDRVLQRGVVMLIEPIVEQEFLDCSYGFRPGKSAHQAVATIWKKITDDKISWVVDIDIRKFFDTIDHSHLRTMVRKRVRDGVIVRLIDKWLCAGVMEKGEWHTVGMGTPQGGVISPLLANLYLHEVLDAWMTDVVPAYMKGKIFLVRYADDAIIGCERREDAESIMRVLPKRLGRYGLALHPEKTRLVRFGRPYKGTGKDRDGHNPETFNFLGFTHYWGRSRKGSWWVKRKTAKDRLARAVRNIGAWLKSKRHTPIKEYYPLLCAKMKGHYGYYGITGNYRSLGLFAREVAGRWRYWLNRRGNDVSFTFTKLDEFLKRCPLPRPVVIHSVIAAKP